MNTHEPDRVVEQRHRRGSGSLAVPAAERLDRGGPDVRVVVARKAQEIDLAERLVWSDQRGAPKPDRRIRIAEQRKEQEPRLGEEALELGGDPRP
jgi:hypothetical protein